MALLKISQALIHDPAQNIDGVVGDLWIRDGVVVAAPSDPSEKPDRVVDARGLVAMAGGVDMHCHIAGPKVNLARKMRPEDKRLAEPVRRTLETRSGTVGSVPSTFATGYLYTGMGYTTAIDAAIPPLSARHALEEFHDTPILDKGFLILLGNNHYALRQIAAGEPGRLRDFAAWLIKSSGAFGIKLVNPGGVENWKSGVRGMNDLDTPVEHFGCTARQIIASLAQAAMDLGLPHPAHIHCNNLGVPGNFATTLATMEALEGRRAHFTHIQFHSYGGHPDDQSLFCSETAKLADYFNRHKNLTTDVGQVLFGETTSMTGDGPVGYYLSKITGRKWTNSETEMEAGCGIVPITYKEKSFVHALQWAIGLEWYLMVDDPWRIAMSTDHPNGASFIAYPEIIAQLMSKNYRDEILARVHPRVAEKSRLRELDREYTINEIAIITRSAPARMLGLSHKGHLAPGADGDVTLYQPDSDKRRMFEFPRYVIKSGEVVVDNAEMRRDFAGRLLHVRPGHDTAAMPDIRKWFESFYTIQFDNYPVDEHYFDQHTVVDCRPGG
jgi:formylmethanofuran dehydrogenase subunit A